MLARGVPCSPVGVFPRSRPTSWGDWDLVPLTFVGCVSRGSGYFFRAIRTGHSNSMTCRTSMGGGIVWLSSRTPGDSNILSLFLVREGVSGLSRAQALEDLLCLGPRPLQGGKFAGERCSAALARRKGNFGLTGSVVRRPFPRGYILVREFVGRYRKWSSLSC